MDRQNAGLGAILVAFLGAVFLASASRTGPPSATDTAAASRGPLARAVVRHAFPEHTGIDMIMDFLDADAEQTVLKFPWSSKGPWPTEDSSWLKGDPRGSYKTGYIIATLPDPSEPPLSDRVRLAARGYPTRCCRRALRGRYRRPSMGVSRGRKQHTIQAGRGIRHPSQARAPLGSQRNPHAAGRRSACSIPLAAALNGQANNEGRGFFWFGKDQRSANSRVNAHSLRCRYTSCRSLLAVPWSDVVSEGRQSEGKQVVARLRGV